MKVIILAGGLGSRLGRLVEDIPKPMVKIGELPIIEHIIRFYCHFDNSYEFIVASGYKSEVLENYFKGSNIKVINTGLSTQTGGRLIKLKDVINGEKFMFTYGDGLSNIDINKLLEFHSSHNGILSVSAVRPPSRFGRVKFDANTGLVNAFVEKAKTDEGFINGGYMVANPDVFNYITEDGPFETRPMQDLTHDKKLYAYKHIGWWRCVDTETDLNLMNNLVMNGETPWIF